METQLRHRSDDLVVCSALVRFASAELRSVDVVASTDAIDSYGEVVDQTWNLDRYMSNPVVLYAHDSRELPIGKATNVRVEDGKLVATLKFASAVANPRAEQVWQLMQQDMLRAVSVGFRPGRVTIEQRDGKDVYVLSDNTLHEISVVTVPANPQALVSMRQRAAKALVERAAVSYGSEPVSDDSSWDGSAAVNELRRWASSDGSGDKEKMDWAKYRKGFAWYDAENPEDFGSYKLPHHRVVDGELVTSKSGVEAAAGVMSGARGGADVGSDADAVKAHLAKHYHQWDGKAPWESSKSGDQNMKSLLVELGLAESAEESEAVSAVKSMSERAGRAEKLVEKLLASTEQSDADAAFGVVDAWKSDAARAKELEAQLGDLRSKQVAADVDAALADAQKDKRVTPAEVSVLRAKGLEDPAWLKGYLAVKSSSLQLPVVQEPAPKHAPLKSWKEMPPVERARLYQEDPETYKALKAAAGE